MSVLSEENTNMLFGLFDDITKENNEKISINDTTQLKQFITQQCYYYHNKRFDFANDINEMNKKIIDSSFAYYNQMLEQKKALEERQKESEKQQAQIPKQMTNNMQTTMTNNMQTTMTNIIDRPVSNIINNSNITLEYEKQKNDFDSHIKPKQKEIDFTDPNKDKPINNLDIIMNQTLADRQNELMQITQQYNKTKETTAWLNTKINNKSDFEPSQPVEILKIDNSSDLKLETQEIKKRAKRVSFNIEEQNIQEAPMALSMSSLLSKLKKKKQPQNLKKEEEVMEDKPQNLKKEKEVVEDKPQNLKKEEKTQPIINNSDTILIKQIKEQNKEQNKKQNKEQNKKQDEYLQTIIEKLNIVILNQENVFKEINNIKSNQDKILVEINEFKSLGLPPI